MPRPRNSAPHLEHRRGKWSIVWWEGEQRRRLSTGTEDKDRARQALEDFKSELQRRPNQIGMREVFSRYVQSRQGKVQAPKRLKEAVVPLEKFFGYLRIDQINQEQWDRYAGQRIKRKSKADQSDQLVSPGTLRREFNVLRAALRRAWKDGFIIKPPELEPPRDSAPRDRYLTKIEARRLLEAAETPHIRLFIAIALFTGARKGSILALTWDRVNFHTGMIDFQEPGRPLTAKRRAVVPMMDILREEMERAYPEADCDHVISWHGKPVPTGLRHSFRKVCIRARLGWIPTPHILKHSLASWFAMDEVPIDIAAQWFATDANTLRRTYIKFDPTYLKSVSKRFKL